MRFKINTNVREIIPELDRFKDSIDEKVRNAMNQTLRDGEVIARNLASTSLPGGGGSYNEAFIIVPASRGDRGWRGRLSNVHPFARGVEEGGGPTGPVNAKAMAISSGRSPYMETRVFKKRRVPRAFRIMENTAKQIKRILPRKLIDQFRRLH